MHAEFYDELPKSKHKTGWKRYDLYEQLSIIKNIGRKYTKLTMTYPGEYASTNTMLSSVRGSVTNYPEFSKIFKVRMINGELWLIRTDL